MKDRAVSGNVAFIYANLCFKMYAAYLPCAPPLSQYLHNTPDIISAGTHCRELHDDDEKEY